MSGVVSYSESRERIIFSSSGSKTGSVFADRVTGDVVSLVLVMDFLVPGAIGRRCFFSDVDTGATFMLYNDSPEVLGRLFGGYTVEQGGTVAGVFEVFRNGVAIDLLKPVTS